MSAVVQRSNKTTDASLATDAAANATSIAERIANLWPATMIIFALVLTLCWNAGLLLLVWQII
jgi:hypothetical protein